MGVVVADGLSGEHKWAEGCARRRVASVHADHHPRGGHRVADLHSGTAGDLNGALHAHCWRLGSATIAA